MAVPIIQYAPAKINLALHVTRRRVDGYHELESLVVFAGVADKLAVVPAKSDRLILTGPFAKILRGDNTNLVMRAVSAFRECWPDAVSADCAFILTKNLPIAAGIGGGSADAAAALQLMAILSKRTIPVSDLAAIAASLGADVPACLVSTPVLMRGIGERLTPLSAFPACYIVLINPMVPLATVDVFRRLAISDNSPLPDLPSPMMCPEQLGFWLAETRNDLQAPAVELVPVIGEVVAQLGRMQGCIFARMSGSGATCFGLFLSSDQAHQVAQRLRAVYPDYWVAVAPLLLP